jgi:hypothetical protein
MHNWSTFGVRTSHEQTWTHKTHHCSHLGETITFPLIVYSMFGHGTSTQMAFCPWTPMKFPKLGLSQFWEAITLCVDLQSKCGLKQSCSFCQKIYNNMLHATYTQGNRGDSRLLVVRSQIGNLIPSPSFGHNLCLECVMRAQFRHLHCKSFPMI